MPKMGLQATIEAVEQGMAWPGTTISHVAIAADDLKKYGLRKPKGDERTHYLVWALGVGEMGAQLTHFFGFDMLDAAKKAYAWKFPNAEVAIGS